MQPALGQRATRRPRRHAELAPEGVVKWLWSAKPRSSARRVRSASPSARRWRPWIAILILLWPACRAFARLKARRRDAWLSYF